MHVCVSHQHFAEPFGPAGCTCGTVFSQFCLLQDQDLAYIVLELMEIDLLRAIAREEYHQTDLESGRLDLGWYGRSAQFIPPCSVFQWAIVPTNVSALDTVLPQGSQERRPCSSALKLFKDAPTKLFCAHPLLDSHHSLETACAAGLLLWGSSKHSPLTPDPLLLALACLPRQAAACNLVGDEPWLCGLQGQHHRSGHSTGLALPPQQQCSAL